MRPIHIDTHINRVIEILEGYNMGYLITHLDDGEYVRSELEAYFRTCGEVPMELDWIYAQYKDKMTLSIYGSGIDSVIIDHLKKREVEDYETIEWSWVRVSLKDSDNKKGLIHHFDLKVAN